MRRADLCRRRFRDFGTLNRNPSRLLLTTSDLPTDGVWLHSCKRPFRLRGEHLWRGVLQCDRNSRQALMLVTRRQRLDHRAGCDWKRVLSDARAELRVAMRTECRHNGRGCCLCQRCFCDSKRCLLVLIAVCADRLFLHIDGSERVPDESLHLFFLVCMRVAITCLTILVFAT